MNIHVDRNPGIGDYKGVERASIFKGLDDMNTNQNFENTAEIGDTVKSIDFQPRADYPTSFVVGKVVEKGMTANGFMGFTIQVEKRVWSGEEVEADGGLSTKALVMTPFKMMADFDNRITKI
jgi:hypothetical protein